jgi:hypothetical protein
MFPEMAISYVHDTTEELIIRFSFMAKEKIGVPIEYSSVEGSQRIREHWYDGLPISTIRMP